METISLARGVPAPELLPAEELADCAGEVLRREGRALLNYGPAAGYEPLRAWVAERHAVDASRVFLTPGSLPGLVLLFQALLAAGRRPIVEAPSYDRPLGVLATLGARPAAVPLGEEGPDLDVLERAFAAGPAFFYAIPTFQNPSGRTYTAGVRQEVLRLARRYGVLVLEDDPYRLVRFGGEPPPTLFDLARGEDVVYAASFSKVVAPGLRVGYLIVPPELAGEVEQRALATYLSPALALQATLLEFIARGGLERTLARMCAGLAERRDALLAALHAHLAGTASWTRPEGGYFVWLDLDGGVPSPEVAERALAAGVAVVAGSDFYRDGQGGRSALRLAYSFPSARQLADGVARLASAIAAPAPV